MRKIFLLSVLLASSATIVRAGPIPVGSNPLDGINDVPPQSAFPGQIPSASQGIFTSPQSHDAYLVQQQNEQWQEQQAAINAQRQAQQTAANVAAWTTFRDAEVLKLQAQSDKDLEILDANQKADRAEIATQLELIQNKIEQLTAENAVWVTNIVKPTPDYRMVNGQVYDTSKSEKWGVPPYPEVPNLNPLDNPWNVIKYSIEFQQIKSEDKITCGIYRNEYQHETYTGQLGLENKEFVRWIIIKNYPDPQSLTTGSEITPRCMRVDNYINADGLSFEAYDCGTLLTNDVPIKVMADFDPVTQKAIDGLNAQMARLNDKKADLDKERSKIEAARVARVNDLPRLYIAKLKAIASEKKQAIQDKVLKINQDAADKGDAYGLLRMGERYRDGDGVDKDLTKARIYLTRAADAGSPTAADEVKDLPAN